MLLNLKELLAGKIKNKLFDYSFDMSGTCINGVHPFVSPVSVKGSVKAFEGSAQLGAAVSFDFSIPCDRCARQIDRHYGFSFSHILVPSLENEDDSDKFIEVKNGQLNLDDLVMEDILLGLPTKFLCRKDCKGLCPICGKNLNDGPCSCDRGDDAAEMNTLKNMIHK